VERGSVITCVQLLEGVHRTNFVRAKTSKLRRNFWQLSTLSANNSGIDHHNKNLNIKWSTTAPPTLGVKNLMKFGPQTKKLQACMLTHPTGLFSGGNISACRGCCPLKFLHTLQPPKLYFQLDLGRRVASSWALPHISSVCLACLYFLYIPSVLWYCWLGLLPVKTVSRITYTVLVGT